MAGGFALIPHQRAEASLSTGVEGFGMSSVEARRMSASTGSLVATLPAVLADLSGSLGGESTEESTGFITSGRYLGGIARPSR